MHRMHRSISILAAVGFAAVTASPAVAEEPREARSIVVMVSPGDFATANARAAFDRRMESAIEDLCGVNAAAAGVDWGELKKCRAQARQNLDTTLASLPQTNTIRLSAR